MVGKPCCSTVKINPATPTIDYGWFANAIAGSMMAGPDSAAIATVVASEVLADTILINIPLVIQMLRVAIGSQLPLHPGPSSGGPQATFETQNGTKTEMVLYFDHFWVYMQFPNTSSIMVLRKPLT